MRVKLGGLELPAVQEVTVYDRRSLAEHKPPGMSGSLFQNMGRQPTRIVLWGIASGPASLSLVEKLDRQFRAAKPAAFVTGTIAGAGVSQTVIEDLRLQDLAGKPNRVAYALVLREFIKPSKGADHSALNAGIKASGQHLTHSLAARLTKPKRPRGLHAG